MSEISVYDIVPTPKLADKLIGTSVGGVIEDVTYNFTLQELLQLFIPNLPANNLQGVLDYGNTATQNINLTGTITTTNLSVLATANILNSNLSGNTRVMAGLFDRTNASGTSGQFLRSTGTQVEWFTIPTVIPTLQQVLTSGNTADRDIILTANITAVTATAANVVSNTALSVNGVLRDGTASAGGSDQILSSTGSGVRWVDMPVYNVISPLLYNSVTKTFSIQPANGSQNGYLSSADWINFDGKQDAIVLTTAGTSGAATFVGNTLNIPVYSPDLSGYVPVSRTLTINGVTYDLSANRSWTIDAGVAEVTATAPLSSSGGAYPDISISQSSSSADGYLSSIDWIDFNSKQDGLNGTGLVKSTAGVITYITDNSTNWNTAYNDSIVSAAVTGTATKTLTLNQQDGGTIQASWSDIDTGLTSVGLSMPSAFTVTNSPLTSNGTIGVTGAGTTLQYVRGDGSLATFPTIASEAQRLVTEVYNRSGATLTKGTVVYVNGGQGNLPTITKAIATGDATSAQTYGVVQTDITNMNNGYVVVIGSLQNIDTQAYTEGTQLYLSSTVAGAWTSVKQYAPAHLVYVGIVIRSHPTQGVVEIRIQNGFEMDELHNVFAQSPTNNAILQYKTATSLWTSVDGTTTNIAEGTNLYYLDSRARAALSFTAGSGAYNSTTGVITIPTNTNQLTNGASFITLSSLSAASPLSYDNSIGAFSISQSGASTDGYLSSTDWNTFNNKQVAGNYITSLTGEATGTGPGATAVTLNNASVTGKVLTGVNITGGTVLATDTMLTAFGKLQNQINGLVGSTIYQGVWDASTNTPTLTSSVGTNGFYYIVNVAGSTNLNGITDWKIGDWAIFNGGVWQKVDNTESVTSVNGFTGAVSLTTDNIAEGTTNLYFANSLARAAVSLTTTGSSGVATYNNTTGVFNIPNYGSALSGYLPLTGGTLTGGLYINPTDTGVVGLDVASNTIRFRSDNLEGFKRQLTTTMSSGTLVKMQAAGFGGTYVTDLGFYTSSSSAINTTPNLYLTGGNNRVGINTDVPAHTLDVVGTAGVSGVLTLGSTISNGTFTYTLPGATGTLALVGGAGVGTVTSVAALTLGTTGTDLSSTVANGTTTPVITLNVPTASATNRGALSSADWTTFNSKQEIITLTTTGSSGASTFTSNTLNVPNYTLAGLGGQPLSTNLTSLAGLTFASTAFVKMTAAGTFALDTTAYGTGTVTSVAALTIGTTGTDLSSTVATGTTTPVITLNVPTASATNRGALSAADWTTFNSKQNALTNPVTGTGTTNKIPKFTGASTLGNSIITEGTGSITVSGAAVDNYVASFINTDAGSPGIYVKSDGPAFVCEPTSLVGGITLYSGGAALFSGDITANKYIKIGGTSSQFLMADGSVSTGPAGGITGSGTATQVAFFNGTNSISSSSGLFWDNTNSRLSIGTSTPTTARLTLAANSDADAISLAGFQLLKWNSGDALIFGGYEASQWQQVKFFAGGTQQVQITTASVNFENSILVKGIYNVPSSSYFVSGANGYRFNNSADTFNNVIFYDNGNTYTRGNVLIGTTTDSGFKLDVNGTGRIQGALNVSDLITTSDGYQGRYFRIYEASAQRGGLYPYNVISGAGTDYSIGLFSESTLWFAAGGGVTKHLSIASTGAATFSNSVTATNSVIASSTSNAGLTAATNSTTGFAFIDLINNGASGKNYQIGIAGNAAAAGYANNLYFDLVGVGNVMTLTSGRQVLIGLSSTSETTKLFVKQSQDFDYRGISVESAAAGGFFGSMSINATGDLSFAQSYTGGSGSYKDIRFVTSNVERMRILSGGDIQFLNNIAIKSVASSGYIATYANGGGLYWGGVASTNQMHLNSSGFLGIGTISPFYALDVYNTGASLARVRVVGTTNFSLLQAQNDSGALYMGIDSSTAGGFSLGNYTRLIWSSGGYPLAFAVGDAERMRITSGGNVLIGTPTDGGYKLDVSGQIRSVSGTPLVVSMSTTGANDAVVAARWQGGTGIEMRYFPDLALCYFDSTYPITAGQVYGDMRFRVNAGGTMTPVMTIKANNSSVGIGTTSPSGKLDVIGDIRGYSFALTSDAVFRGGLYAYRNIFGSGSDYGVTIFAEGGTGNGNIYFCPGGSATRQATITTGGNFLIGTTTDATGKLQVNGSIYATSFFESSSVAGKNILATNPNVSLNIDVIKYTRKNVDTDDIRYGYSAEQINSLMPELTNKDITAVKYLDVHTLLIAELQKEIKELKAKLN